jgi:hypothetical protein
MYDKDWNFKQISLPFYFEELFVEFCLSISVEENQITIFYSKEDNESKMMKISYDKINWM